MSVLLMGSWPNISWFLCTISARESPTLSGIGLTILRSGHENSAMGLNAWVCCNCIREGTALPHPFPELLVFDKTGEPTLKSESEISLEQWLRHDEWHPGKTGDLTY